jgi:hypothetical protein
LKLTGAPPRYAISTGSQAVQRRIHGLQRVYDGSPHPHWQSNCHAFAVCPALTFLNRRRTDEAGRVDPTDIGHLQGICRFFQCCIQQALPAAADPGTPPTAARTLSRTKPHSAVLLPAWNRGGLRSARNGTGSDSRARASAGHSTAFRPALRRCCVPCIHTVLHTWHHFRISKLLALATGGS